MGRKGISEITTDLHLELKKLDVYRNGTQLFSQELGYDGDETVAGTVPLHTGLVTRKDEAWIAPGGTAQMHIEGYAYDYAGRLSKESIDGSLTSYTYDPRGNIVSITDGSSTKSFSYDGDRPHTAFIPQELEFTHDQFGRMTFDGLSGQTIIYNNLDLVKNIKRNDTTLVNYSYLADGTKVEARRYTIGKWLIYRGPFVYRVHTTNSYYPESVEFSGGRVTRTGAMLHVKDYLGSVRAVIDGSTGTIYKAADYSAFGAESPAGSMQIAAIPNNTHPLTTITLRDGYTGKEDQTPEFGTGYIDFGARQYSPSLRRWMTPDPMSENYYGTSPYAFCANNPVNFVDPDGKFPLFSNFVGGIVSAGVEYGSQVIGNIVSNRFSVESFTNVDVFDIGVAFGEGFITSGTNVARRVITKAAVELTGEIARNTVDIQVGYGTDHTPIVNSFGDVIVDTIIGVVSEVINVDVNISPFKGISNTKAVRAAREAADESLLPQVADGVRRQNAMLNAEKAAANQAISEGVGSVTGSVVSKVIDEIQDKYRD